MNLLAGDVGGTKTLLGIFSWDGELKKLYQKKYSSTEWESLEPMIASFIRNLPDEIDHPKIGCIALAGPIVNNSFKLTNLGWEVRHNKILKVANLDSLELINDSHNNAEKSPSTKEPNRIISKKIGRNDLCPCGSGKKYKICHGA